VTSASLLLLIDVLLAWPRTPARRGQNPDDRTPCFPSSQAIAFLRKRGFDADLWAHADSSAIRERLARNNEDAVAGGVFGVPSFFVGSELFFGNAQR
jgi:hypothetical protein